MKISAKNEKKLVETILTKIGLKKEYAEIVADATLDADLKGFTSHGIGRFHQYIKGIEAGNINIDGELEIVKETPAIALVNGNSIFGQVVAYKSMELAIKKAKELGIGAVGTHNSNHFGATGYYPDLASKEGLIGMAFANTEPAIAPLGGKEPILGTNPIAISVPGEETYIAVDMATSATARGKLLEAQRKGEKIPEGMALDEDGNPTTDPNEALKGSILPFGAHKGYGLAFMIEILTGPLVGAAFGKSVTGTANHCDKCTKGDLFIAIDPDKFVGIDEFKNGTESFVDEIRSSTPDTIIPGDIETNRINTNKQEGIKIDQKLYDNLAEICNNLDINLDEYIEE